MSLLPYPLEEFQVAKPGEGSGGETEGKEKEVVEAITLIPFPSLVPYPEDNKGEAEKRKKARRTRRGEGKG